MSKKYRKNTIIVIQRKKEAIILGRKLYILDTNVLISDPNAIHAFDDNIVLIPTQVLEELDNHKNDSGDRGYNVRRAIRNLNALKTKGKLNDGVPAGPPYCSLNE